MTSNIQIPKWKLQLQYSLHFIWHKLLTEKNAILGVGVVLHQSRCYGYCYDNGNIYLRLFYY